MRPLPIVTALRERQEDPESDVPLDFRQVFEEYGRYVWRVLRRMGVRESDVPDVAQEVFMILRRKLDRVAGPGSLRAFIYGIAVREASGHRRSARVRHETVTDAPPERIVDAAQHSDVERTEALRLLRATLELLDDDKRAVFVLYELEELEMREVAEAIGCPIQTAYSRLHAARAAVSHAFERIERSAR